MGKKTMWDRRRKIICPVCDKEVTFEEYTMTAIDKPVRMNIPVHKDGCVEAVYENPEILLKAIEEA